MLDALADDLWTLAAPFSVAGLEVGVRMTLVRLPDGRLFVHSPLELTPERKAAVDALGDVGFLVAPNKVHHLYLDAWLDAYPQAELHGAVGLPDKRRDLRFDGVLVDGRPHPAWADVLAQQQFYGSPYTNETVFLHRPSRTLLLTDLAFHIVEAANWLTRMYLKLGSCEGRLKTTAIMRMTVRNKDAARRSVERLLEWDFGRIVVSHGEVLEDGGPDALRGAFEWL